MTVTNQTKKVIANGNDVADTFSFSPMVLQAASDMVCQKQQVDGTIIDIPSGSTGDTFSVIVSGDYPQTGSVKYPNSGTKLATGEMLSMERVMDETQPTDLENQTTYFGDVVETALDRVTMLLIQAQDSVESLKLIQTTLMQTIGLNITLNINDTPVTTGSLTGYARLDQDNVWVKRQAAKLVTITDAAPVSWDMSAGGMFDLTLGGNHLINVTGVKNGDTGVLWIKQDGTGGRVPTVSGSIVLIGFLISDLVTTANKKSLLTYAVENNVVYLTLAGTGI